MSFKGMSEIGQSKAAAGAQQANFNAAVARWRDAKPQDKPVLAQMIYAHVSNHDALEAAVGIKTAKQIKADAALNKKPHGGR